MEKQDDDSKNSTTEYENNSNHDGDATQLRFIADAGLCRVAKHLRLMGVDCACDPQANCYYIVHMARKENRIILTRKRDIQRIINASQRKSYYFDRPDIYGQRRKKEIYFDEDNSGGGEEQEEDEDESHDSATKSNNNNNDGDQKPGTSSDLQYYVVKSIHYKEQIVEVVNHFKIRFNKDLIFSRCLLCNVPIELVEEKSTVRSLVHENVYNEHEQFYRCPKCSKIYWGTENDNPHINYKSAVEFAERYSYNDKHGNKNTGTHHHTTTNLQICNIKP